MEAKINELEGVKLATINFVTKTLIIEIEDERQIEAIVEKIKEIVRNIESHVVIKEKKHQPPKEGHNHGNHHDHNHEGGDHRRELIKLGMGIVFFVMALVFKMSNVMEFGLYLISYLLVGSEVLLKAVRNILRGEIFDENFLMGIATIGAFAIGEFPEGVAVMVFYQIGEFFQDLAVNRSRKSIAALMDIRPDYANLKIGNAEKRVSPEEVAIGDYIVIKPGEKVALDGVVTEGRSMVDTSALTGESVPREVGVGSDVLAGFINTNGLLTVEVRKPFKESTVSKILELVENASSKKAPTENFITKFAKYYTPVVVFVALALAVMPPLLLEDATFSEWFYRALIFLVISCPCALVVSIPLGFLEGLVVHQKTAF